MPDLHLQLERSGRLGLRSIVAIDTEWAKNWRTPVTFEPFCAAVHVLDVPERYRVLNIESWSMRTELYFRSADETVTSYAKAVDEMVARHVSDRSVVVGHQLSSDLHLLRRNSAARLPMIDEILERFRTRHSSDEPRGTFVVRDTRYDIRNRVTGDGGEKLRNVSLRLHVFAVQTELRGTSLTKLYNVYRKDNDRGTLEKLMVLNWRHAFQTALVWLVDSSPSARLPRREGRAFLLTNDIIHRMSQEHLSYVRSPEYLVSCSRGGVAAYVRDYAPVVAREVGLL